MALSSDDDLSLPVCETDHARAALPEVVHDIVALSKFGGIGPREPAADQGCIHVTLRGDSSSQGKAGECLSGLINSGHAHNWPECS